MALLTTARRSLWTAIDNYAPLRQVGVPRLQQTYRFDDQMPLQKTIQPSISRLPALAIFPQSVAPFWWTNEMQQWPVLYQFLLWTPHWSLPPAEELIELVIDAIYRATPADSTVPYVKAATGYYPLRVGPITFAKDEAGDGQAKVKAIRTEAAITLRTTKDPFAS